VTTFTPDELAYLASQPLGRLATADSNGRPHVVPIGFFVNAAQDAIDIGGFNFGARKKYHDVQRNPWVALVVDDLVSADPWTVRMLEIRGPAEALATGGAALMDGFADEMIRIRPARIVSYNLDGSGSGAARSV
jgi:pyridoxamine 5'-phosphate oxidase family protein